MTENDSAVLQEFVSPGYKLVHQPRNNRRGGGTGLVFKEIINASQTAAGEKNSESHPVSVSSFVS